MTPYLELLNVTAVSRSTLHISLRRHKPQISALASIVCITAMVTEVDDMDGSIQEVWGTQDKLAHVHMYDSRSHTPRHVMCTGNHATRSRNAG